MHTFGLYQAVIQLQEVYYETLIHLYRYHLNLPNNLSTNPYLTTPHALLFTKHHMYRLCVFIKETEIIYIGRSKTLFLYTTMCRYNGKPMIY